jgi:hypothetical protein
MGGRGGDSGEQQSEQDDLLHDSLLAISWRLS